MDLEWNLLYIRLRVVMDREKCIFHIFGWFCSMRNWDYLLDFFKFEVGRFMLYQEFLTGVSTVWNYRLKFLRFDSFVTQK